MKADIEIARDCRMKPIAEVARVLDIPEDDLELYGKYKAKLSDTLWNKLAHAPLGKLVLVTAINPTPAGEGKTTVTVGLGQALSRLGKRATVALREPSLGPCFGIKGGASGGGYAQVVPMEELNLHFTGDFHAITSANNLLAALLDNHIHQGNALGIDSKQIVIKRCLDMNDRVLRNIVVGLGGKADGVVREDRFVISVASEIMAILCLAGDLADLKRMLGNMIVAWRYDGSPVTTADLGATGALAVLLKDALKPNLVQTLENSPAIVHGGPFANIAHGCNSVRATRLALKLADVVVTEAGFGADLGAEKFFDIKCRKSGLKPDAVVLVATVRALKYNGGAAKSELAVENLAALERGIVNLGKHIENLQKFGVPVVVTLNAFVTDTPAEQALISDYCRARGCEVVLTEVWEKGGEGGMALARSVLNTLENRPSDFRVLYPDAMPLEDKIATIAREIYGADGVTFGPAAQKALKKISDVGMASFPVCIAKTQYSLSDDPKKLGRPEGFTVHIRDAYVAAGAGFVVALAGDIMTMPGLPKTPAALGIDIDDNGLISGLF
ncbi:MULTISPECIES: formate--tetrahydrofolate ligase [Tenebrionibacter/Tenebrionicola group]|uniref:Formate--tetrahydrofolate ligase n=2 Tax=Tenebrionibacter/Tenebrionicola group TaxID=2969848 RepID=A0A8K0UZK4_9ENTR|nr:MULTISPECIES: formate--tetrahydrofolate ligase [Tenebrionibacter/Tenebrionicola group]MBK4714339.1 formate--tetrahydrofolate ligase [Tenebrionibacter intestinalis]MBV4414334.1 formate--tetrahydrofolate ligase [Tenebrionicola larvae]MBV5095254.1 formate--tetrahydrofolate ligase [Tenebrionicola larvae]